MKICAIICEFNPFHNGHKYVLEQARALSGCDALVCVMSGQFTQRGEMCRTDKFLRAKHAVLAGADAVIELPTPFAVAPAEIFAAGAIKLIDKIEGDLTLAFGCESGDRKSILSAAHILNSESEDFKRSLNGFLDAGESYIKSYSAAFSSVGGDPRLISQPNNVLAVEYVKQILKRSANIEILPVKRIGSDYNDETLLNNFSSAGAIRANADDERIRGNMPEYSYLDFIANPDNTKRFEQLAADYLFKCDKENLKRVYGCTEGLENRLKKLAATHCGDYQKIVGEACSKRYTATRIKRILCANLLNVYADEAAEFLNSDLPHGVLAIKRDMADALLPLFKPCNETEDISCNKITSSAYALWKYLNPISPLQNPNEKMILI